MLPAMRAAIAATMRRRLPSVKRVDRENDGERREKFHQSSVVIVIDIGAVDPAALGGRPDP